MKWKIQILLIGMLFPLITSAQPWLFKYDLPEWKSQEIWSFVKDYDKGYLLSLNVCNFSPLYDQHGLLMKLDDNGQIIYQLKFGEGQNFQSYVENIRQRVHGILLIAGAHLGTNFGKPFISLLDSCHNKIWCTVLDNNPTSTSWFVDALLLADSSILALSIYSDPDFIQRPFHLHKFNKYGEQLWRKAVASRDLHPLISNTNLSQLLQLSDGSFLITGLCYLPNPGTTSPHYPRMLLVRTDADGNETGFYAHGVNDYINSYAQVSFEHNGKIYTGGAQYTAQGYSIPHLYVNDLNLNPVYDAQVTIPGTGQRSARYQVVLSPHTGSSFFGSTQMYLPDPEDEGVPAFVKLDTNGVVSDFFMHSDTTLSSMIFPQLSEDNRIIQAGGYGAPTAYYKFLYQMRLKTDPLRLDSIPWSSFNYDTLCPDSIISQIVPMDNCRVIVSNDDYKPPLHRYTLEMIPYPVPAAGDILSIRYSNTLLYRNISVRCYDATGRQVKEFTVLSGMDSSETDISSLSPGIYIAVAFSKENQIGKCKFIVQ